ncbi:TPA: hypothetical protein DHW62_00395 [candidate division WWE3 bacterium]|uniref:Uncharacterized protein n=1 Tax=candidate division WWE3 bacterium TaxID=2053526 RepID=A0A656PP95_UNCKA|nr:hypothetical protein P147_WWE3C00001G0189 [candidate division WWE3 bacterium RAAC2_WWE3_1]KKS29866.1 MAG: hypothetical protein UU91_C0003G0024 [candidate division WWE3 bacterium GW2011_GWB1_42_117]KKS55291.1 MAG: hypothetical protein UV21_C0002G0165 [candidate division WWE3 bacterium GW2011_GWD2_42_34]KKT05844.1 MAG: hypothetical protein UV83_C0001G0162 [candidate division WWE3 bacterium GW2011_GWE2_43_18]KKT07266.1 MAG: hypothetical protein UV84_C0001G0102 [candidate division WWE3 bacterium
MINFIDYLDFFIFIGGTVILVGILYFFFRDSLKDIFISEDDIAEPEISKRSPVVEILFSEDRKNNPSSALIKKIGAVFIAIIIGGFVLNQFLMWKMTSSAISERPFDINISISKK